MPINSKYVASFKEGGIYHIYNRGHSYKKIFLEEKNYHFFLNLIKKYLIQHVDVLAYCLLPNHFHLLIKIKENLLFTKQDEDINKFISNQFRKLFISYTNAFSKEYNLRGGIFTTPFRRIIIADNAYFTQIVYYIHYNPVHHNICSCPAAYLFSSYNAYLTNKNSLLQKEEVLNWFGNTQEFIKYHNLQNTQYQQQFFYIE